ncbi:MAG TPA: bifunctional folylpolyglutamate synthase/dihydrofolate synthase, partial [Candidatus Methylomirabilis sp.]|nr:bifunctional folylpolyglutamate synthase/dihydrofolate synthase [Candidatus Methylomirabilis sp.]
KDQAGILRALAPVAERLILTAYHSPRAAAPAALRAHAPAGAARIETADSLGEALLLAGREPRTPVVCVAGSLYLIGEALTHLREGHDLLCGLSLR